MHPAVLNLVLTLGLMQVANFFKIDKEENVNIIRIAYGAMQAISFAALLIVWRKVVAINDRSPLVYVESKNPLDRTETETVRITVRDYDVQKILETARSQAIAIAIMGFMHYKWGYIRPLFLQAVLGLKGMYQQNLVKVHLLGEPATGGLARPWKTASPFGETVKPTTEKALKAEQRKAAKKKGL
ncbi:inorganic phosphate transporter Pho88 [Geranomyces variabilis]|nr:inorganic phosphate transporter Pho88 [Geranomyces variabilis]KAJ3136091.1 hypothetical protein HDU90_003494 [Geranomyces variabilis]